MYEFGLYCRQLELVPRPLSAEGQMPLWLYNTLWSDPTNANGIYPNERGPGIVKFGPDMSKLFCAKEGLKMIIRSHQWSGKGFEQLHGGLLLSIFSARDYTGRFKNNSSLALIYPDDESGNLRVGIKSLEAIGI